MRIYPFTVAVPLAAAIALAGCGSGSPGRQSSSPLATSRGDTEFVSFTQCMRAHGVNMPDPIHRPGHAGLTLEMPTMAPATVTAYHACKPIIQDVINAKEAGARASAAGTLTALVRFAQCMRQHGIPMLDPNQQGQLNLGTVNGTRPDIGRYSPQFHQADQACRHLLPASASDDGTGP
jgi:hypothetical protein